LKISIPSFQGGFDEKAGWGGGQHRGGEQGVIIWDQSNS